MTSEDDEILLVEDEPADAELIASALDTYDLAGKLYHVKDGEEALNYLFGRGLYAYRNGGKLPKFILLDLKLPKVSGLEILRQVRADEHTRRIPVVVFTSSREEMDKIESYNLGVNSYVLKPVNPEDFARTISEVGLYWMLFNAPSG
jgi:CheY-like chemotaxis protein